MLRYAGSARVNVMRSNSCQNISSKIHKVNRETGWSSLTYELP